MATMCRQTAYDFFNAQIARLETTDGLLKASIAVSMHALDDVDPDDVYQRLELLADQVNDRFQSMQLQAKLAHLHEFLFEEEGFENESGHFQCVLSSFLPAVLESRRGLPTTLALIYKFVAERIGLTVEGINAPGCFLNRVQGLNGWIIIDPADRGKILSQTEALMRVARTAGVSVSESAKYIKPASHAQWVTVILSNLRSNLAHQKRDHDLAAMTELQSLLRPSLN